MKRWMMAATALVAMGCGDSGLERAENPYLAQELVHSDERRLDLGATVVTAATGTADTVYLSSREPGPAYEGPRDLYFDTITGDTLERVTAERSLDDLHTSAGDTIAGCTTGSEPTYATLEGGWSFETLASLSSGCGSEEYLPCWGGKIRQCWVGGLEETSVLGEEPYGVDDAPETALYTWAGGDYSRFDDLDAETWAIGVASDGEPVYAQNSMLANAPEVEQRRHILKGEERLLDIEDRRLGSLQIASHELDVILWHDFETETVEVSLVSSISAPIITLPGGDIEGALLDTYGKTVVAAVVLPNRIVVSSGGTEFELDRSEDEDLEALVVTGNAVHLFIATRFDDAPSQLRREVLELR